MSNKLKALMSSEKQDWGTPQVFIQFIEELFCMKFDLDVCAHPGNNKCSNYYTINDDCLTTEWFGRNVWMNPPFGRELPKFTRRAIDQVEKENVSRVFILVPARTCTEWFHELVNSKYCARIMFFKGRFNFEFSRNLKGANAPFPSILIILKKIAPGRGRIPRVQFVDLPKEVRGF